MSGYLDNREKWISNIATGVSKTSHATIKSSYQPCASSHFYIWITFLLYRTHGLVLDYGFQLRQGLHASFISPFHLKLIHFHLIHNQHEIAEQFQLLKRLGLHATIIQPPHISIKPNPFSPLSDTKNKTRPWSTIYSVNSIQGSVSYTFTLVKSENTVKEPLYYFWNNLNAK